MAGVGVMLRSRSDEEVLVEVQEGPEEGSEGSERRPGEEERCNGDRLSLPPHPSTSRFALQYTLLSIVNSFYIPHQLNWIQQY